MLTIRCTSGMSWGCPRQLQPALRPPSPPPKQLRLRQGRWGGCRAQQQRQMERPNQQRRVLLRKLRMQLRQPPLAQQLSSMAAAAAAAAAAASADGLPNPAALHSSLAAAQQLMAALAQACSALLANAAAAAAALPAEPAAPPAPTAEAAVQTERVKAPRMCGRCGAGPDETGGGLLRCPCTTAYYCSTECQVGTRLFLGKYSCLFAGGFESPAFGSRTQH